ncbi:hypothetical protein [Hyphomicrobium sp. CS1BSMeth3]|uniref:hypothetical protein n=1 Tax=Hyphomicrobium sp. CS1BSMeth3 TaxID=1892844 RepID=UPI0009300478|nr:hypothetical protein [Hyphomicrobium sp. CS1BSMeth3]
MQIKVPPGNNGDLQETREHRLMAFAAASIEKLPGTNDDTPGTILAVARSAESPVAKALVALRPVLAANKVKVRLVFSNDDATLDPFFAGIADDAAAPLAEVRILRDPRLRDAHEQLIVGHMSVWFGDSLRRDIHRRDLFEQFHADAPEAARSAAHGFERLWARTEPCLALPALAADSLTAMPPRKPGNAGPTGTVLC